jgi:Fe-S-cluster containining protein
VRLDEAGVRAAAAFLDLDEAAFRRLYLEPGSPDIGLDEAGYCRFRQGGGLCLIHRFKPAVCRLWPFLPSLLARESAFQDARQACPGLRPELTWAEFKAAGNGAG